MSGDQHDGRTGQQGERCASGKEVQAAEGRKFQLSSVSGVSIRRLGVSGQGKISRLLCTPHMTERLVCWTPVHTAGQRCLFLSHCVSDLTSLNVSSKLVIEPFIAQSASVLSVAAEITCPHPPF